MLSYPMTPVPPTVMAGVLTFQGRHKDHPGLAGLFWQNSWDEWSNMATVPELKTGKVHIIIAEFIAALVTCETFANFCASRVTTLELDNFTVKAWLDTALCTRAPYDRCAQGIHLYILKRNKKVKTARIPSAENLLTDTCSRKTFPWHSTGHMHVIAGERWRRISPKLSNLLKLVK